jgi:hypothetical protein
VNITKANVTKALKLVPFAVWVKTQKGSYDYSEPRECPIAMYLKAQFPASPRVCGGPGYATVWGKGDKRVKAEIPQVIERVIIGAYDFSRNVTWTYEALAKRLENPAQR